MSNAEQGDEEEKLTPGMAIEVFHDRGTPEEKRIVRAALRNPHSVIHDWLEGMQNWAERAFRRQSSNSKRGDQILRDSAAKANYYDVVGFVNQLRSIGKITEGDARQLLDGGPRDKNDVQHVNQDYRRKCDDVLTRLEALHPELNEEIARVRSALGRGTDTGHSL